MLTLISRVSLNKETRDSQVWGVEASGIFSVRSAYTRLAKFDYITHNLVFKQLWQSKAFSNVLITAWRVLLDRMPIRSCLARRGVVNPLICMVCQQSNESSQHLFIESYCDQRVWALCFCWIGIEFVQHKDVQCQFVSFSLQHASVVQNLVWKRVWATVVWCIWEQRNHIIFRQGVVDVEEIFLMTQLKFWQWLKHKVGSFDYSFSNWNLYPFLCLKSLSKGQGCILCFQQEL